MTEIIRFGPPGGQRPRLISNHEIQGYLDATDRSSRFTTRAVMAALVRNRDMASSTAAVALPELSLILGLELPETMREIATLLASGRIARNGADDCYSFLKLEMEVSAWLGKLEEKPEDDPLRKAMLPAEWAEISSEQIEAVFKAVDRPPTPGRHEELRRWLEVYRHNYVNRASIPSREFKARRVSAAAMTRHIGVILDALQLPQDRPAGDVLDALPEWAKRGFLFAAAAMRIHRKEPRAPAAPEVRQIFEALYNLAEDGRALVRHAELSIAKDRRPDRMPQAVEQLCADAADGLFSILNVRFTRTFHNGRPEGTMLDGICAIVEIVAPNVLIVDVRSKKSAEAGTEKTVITRRQIDRFIEDAGVLYLTPQPDE